MKTLSLLYLNFAPNCKIIWKEIYIVLRYYAIKFAKARGFSYKTEFVGSKLEILRKKVEH